MCDREIDTVYCKKNIVLFVSIVFPIAVARKKWLTLLFGTDMINLTSYSIELCNKRFGV